jgi:hypothetical protein
MEDEKRLYSLVRDEFSGLCAAVGDKVAKMRLAADELDDLHLQKQASSSSKTADSTANPLQKKRNQFSAQRSATTSNIMEAPIAASLWQRRVDSLEVSGLHFGDRVI